jgi:hypothetical protein
MSARTQTGRSPRDVYPSAAFSHLGSEPAAVRSASRRIYVWIWPKAHDVGRGNPVGFAGFETTTNDLRHTFHPCEHCGLWLVVACPDEIAEEDLLFVDLERFLIYDLRGHQQPSEFAVGVLPDSVLVEWLELVDEDLVIHEFERLAVCLDRREFCERLGHPRLAHLQERRVAPPPPRID